MTFFIHSQTELLLQRQALQEAERSFEKHQQLSQEREKLETTILHLQREIEREAYQFYQQVETSSHLERKQQEKKKHLQHLKRTQQEIDHLLDHTEHLTVESLEQQRLSLLYSFWQLYPSQRKEQEPLWLELQQLQMTEEKLKEIEQVLQLLCQELEEIIQARQSIKGRGILNYIFGTSPNIIIEHHLLKIHSIIQISCPMMQEIIQNPQNHLYDSLFQDIYVWLDHLKIPSRSSWSFYHIDTIFSEAFQNFKRLLVALQKQQNELLKRKDFLKKESQQWLEQF